MTEAEDGSDSEMQGGIDDSEQEDAENSDEGASGNPPSNDDTQDDGETDYTDDPPHESLNELEAEPTSTSQDDDRLDNEDDHGSVGTLEEQQEFLEELENFFRERKLEFKPPKFYGRDLNWLKFWKAVTGLGGYEQVTVRKLWRQVGDLFNPPKTCTTISWSFRGFYERTLLDYEKAKLGTSGGVAKHAPVGASDQGALSPTTPSSQPSAGAVQGRARRDAAARAMQGWHSQRTNGNGEPGDQPSKDKAPGVTSLKRDKPMKKASPVTKRSTKEQRPPKISKSEVFVPITPKIVDDGPAADWVKINVHRTPDCFEVYALVPGLVREEVRIQCEAGGRLVIAGEPEHPDNPWGVTAFRKVISLPARIDAHGTSAVVTLHGQLCVRVPFAPPET
eukprot:TRINITY_DN7085_c0_g1_i1.p1 TRINITY_DN7085_c0_g1~~TRINITY_DN7085_c0_g1_i1.p1  ORF type:complete len:392 (+),score=79.23 TRINITY_DN7085_c0_g1_i1:282-1457(+)